MKTLWLIAPSRYEDKVPLVSQNRWFKYLPRGVNNIYPVLVSYGVSLLETMFDVDFLDAPTRNLNLKDVLPLIPKYDLVIMEDRTAIVSWINYLANQFKKTSPETRIAVYGDHPMARPEDMAPSIDHIINNGDWDVGAFKLVTALTYGEEVPRLYTTARMRNLDLLPLLNRNLVPWKPYFESWRHRDNFGWLQSSRGCWAKCTFCSWVPTFYEGTYRSMSPKRAVEELVQGHVAYGIDEFLDDSDTFVLKPFGLDFAKRIIDAELDVFWNIQTRADLVAACSVEELKALKKSGLHVVKLGIDGGNDFTLQRIKKGYTVETARKAVENLKAAGLESHVNMIIGWPWEDSKAAYDSIRFVKSLNPNQAQFSLIEPFVGTDLWNEAYEKKWFINDPFDWDRYDMQTPILRGKMSRRELAKLHRDAWGQFYINPMFIAKNVFETMKLVIRERNIDSIRHKYRGYKAVRFGHMKAVE